MSKRTLFVSIYTNRIQIIIVTEHQKLQDKSSPHTHSMCLCILTSLECLSVIICRFWLENRSFMM